MVAGTALSNRTDSEEATRGRPSDVLRFHTAVGESSSRAIADRWQLAFRRPVLLSSWLRHALELSDEVVSAFEVGPDVHVYGRAFEFNQSTATYETQDQRRERPDLFELKRAVALVQTILRDVFGTAAYVVPLVEVDPETSKPENIMEAHYCFEGSEQELEDLIALHEEFLRRYIDEAPPWIRGRWVLRWVAADAD